MLQRRLSDEQATTTTTLLLVSRFVSQDLLMSYTMLAATQFAGFVRLEGVDEGRLYHPTHAGQTTVTARGWEGEEAPSSTARRVGAV